MGWPLTGSVIATPLAAESLQASKVWRIGFLHPGSAAAAVRGGSTLLLTTIDLGISDTGNEAGSVPGAQRRVRLPGPLDLRQMAAACGSRLAVLAVRAVGRLDVQHARRRH